jgi:membrane fusion protein, heavy metal efflux system
MTIRKLFRQVAIWAGVAICAALALAATMPSLQTTVKGWFVGKAADDKEKKGPVSHELVRDAAGKVVSPYTMRLADEAVKGLQVTSQPATKAGPLSLPLQGGQLNYDTDLLFPVRPRFQGEVIEIGKTKESITNGTGSQVEPKEKALGPGDRVSKGDVLAVTWCKEIADRKMQLINAFLDLYLDEAQLKSLQSIPSAIPERDLRAQENKVQKSLAAVMMAQTSLSIARLSASEIEQIEEQTKDIQKKLKGARETPAQNLQRIAEDVKKWATVEVRAQSDGIIVEKNTALHDMVDPSRDTPLYKIYDTSRLLVVANFPEEYLPLLEPLLPSVKQGKLNWKVQIQARPELGTMEFPIQRIAPAVDPNQHTVMVIGRIPNPPDKDRPSQLIAGLFVTVTVEVPAPKDVVEIPTNALNEVNGESLVFVQKQAGKPEYELRRVAVVRRSKDTTLVKSELTPEDRTFSDQEVKAGRRKLNELREADLVVTRGVTEMTDALEELLTKLRAER